MRIVRAIEKNKANGFPCEIGFARRGAVAQHDGWDIPVFFEARQARMQAQSLYRRTRDAQRSQTETRMIDGRFRLSVSDPLPPGLGRARLLDHRGATGQSIGFLDTPAFRPTKDEVVDPLHLCRDDSGAEADQVANVRWALTQLAEGRRVISIGRELATRGFSTTAIARTYRRGATYRSIYGEPDHGVAVRMCRSIRRHLDFYASGRLRLMIGGEPLIVEDCMPSGGWMTSDVVAALREREDSRNSRQPRGSWPAALGGLDVTLGGHTYVLGRAHCECSDAGASHE
jgi:hypothetical protein